LGSLFGVISAPGDACSDAIDVNVIEISSPCVRCGSRHAVRRARFCGSGCRHLGSGS
jgi:hypothetical protein